MKLKTKKVWLYVPVTVRYQGACALRLALRDVKAEIKDCRWDVYPPDEEAHARVGKPRPTPDITARLAEALRLCYDHCRLYHPEVERNNVGQAVREALAAYKETP